MYGYDVERKNVLLRHYILSMNPNLNCLPDSFVFFQVFILHFMVATTGQGLIVPVAWRHSYVELTSQLEGSSNKPVTAVLVVITGSTTW